MERRKDRENTKATKIHSLWLYSDTDVIQRESQTYSFVLSSVVILSSVTSSSVENYSAWAAPHAVGMLEYIIVRRCKMVTIYIWELKTGSQYYKSFHLALKLWEAFSHQCPLSFQHSEKTVLTEMNFWLILTDKLVLESLGHCHFHD